MRSFLLPGLLLSLTAAVIILDGCSKSNADYTSLSGKWRLSYTSGGIAGITKRFPPFSAPVLDLRKDSTYRRTSNFTLLESGVYSLSIINTPYGKDTLISFRRGGDTTLKLLYRINSSLSLQDDAIDGFEDVYNKLP